MTTPKYPVILVHGMMAKDFFFYPAFRGITEYLRSHHIPVYVSNQDGVGLIATNAAQLKAEISAILEKEGCEKVNIIAHSKGGLDSRYLISRLDMGDKVASLTTLSTPHKGSGLSATLLKMPGFLAKTIAFFANRIYAILGDSKPDLLGLGKELTAEAMVDFNQSVPNDPRVYYQSFSSTTPAKGHFLLKLPYRFSRYCEQDDTDGMVSVSSSQWGNYQGSMGESLDHFKMVGIYGSKKKLMGVGLFYLNIVRQLSDMGF